MPDRERERERERGRERERERERERDRERAWPDTDTASAVAARVINKSEKGYYITSQSVTLRSNSKLASGWMDG